MEIWVHPTCTACRAATAALDKAGIRYVTHRFCEDLPATGVRISQLAPV
jgi:arsenate reductase (glutaredoxin)